MLIRVIVFLVINFAGLGLGGLFTGKGVVSTWYQGLNKAPWTPPGWTFGAAWTTIMICFAIFMAHLWVHVEDKRWLIGVFAVQWLLNMAWNPVFFHFQNPILGLVIISTLTLVVGYFFLNFRDTVGWWALLVAPYFIWLLIATSLNAFVVLNN